MACDLVRACLLILMIDIRFSKHFTTPSYQADAVSNYLAKYSPIEQPSYEVNADATNIGEGGGVYNRLGRGYPDVSGAYRSR